jgi:hypothetical protein
VQVITREVSGYRLVVPADWYGIGLDPAEREQSVAALVGRQFTGADSVPRLKAQAERELLARATAAYAAGGVELYLSLQRISGIPVPASLAIFLLPPDDDRAIPPPGRLAQLLAGDDRQVTLVNLPAGRSVRVVRSGTTAETQRAATHEVFVPVPDSGWWLLLAFAAPVGPLAVALSALFDAISTTLRWDR